MSMMGQVTDDYILVMLLIPGRNWLGFDHKPTYCYVLLLSILYIISVTMHRSDYRELFYTMTYISLFIHWTFWKVWKAFFFYHVGSVLSHHQSLQFMQKPWWITLLFSLLRCWQHLLQSTTVSNRIAPVQRRNNQNSAGANMLWQLIIPRLPQLKPPYHHVCRGAFLKRVKPRETVSKIMTL